MSSGCHSCALLQSWPTSAHLGEHQISTQSWAHHCTVHKPVDEWHRLFSWASIVCGFFLRVHGFDVFFFTSVCIPSHVDERVLIPSLVLITIVHTSSNCCDASKCDLCPCNFSWFVELRAEFSVLWGCKAMIHTIFQNYFMFLNQKLSAPSVDGPACSWLAVFQQDVNFFSETQCVHLFSSIFCKVFLMASFSVKKPVFFPMNPTLWF